MKPITTKVLLAKKPARVNRSGAASKLRTGSALLADVQTHPAGHP